ncbi:hypothetical protein HPB49_004261 [Dermacentor silvarum]|uniref:Uncharacterized protein n=1 Tax=Dermacentor silvarum TaxID=543639 RepID=A0ACB8CVB0_DERSI|nr:hypothetical protein HPB49_004261 [Dermacentor silvarum]
MMEGQVEVTTLREEHYDPSDWTKIIGTYQGKSQSKFRIEDTKQKACEEHTGTLPASTWRPTYRPNPAHLRATRQVKRRRRLFLPNIQPQLLLRCLCERRIYPMEQKCNYACTRVHPTTRASIFDGYTCTVATSSQEAALNLVKIRSITLNAKSYGVAAYIVPAADTVSGVISNAFWDKTEEELLQDQQARNPEAGILLARRMGKSISILITFAQGPIPVRIIHYGGVHLCTPYSARPEACTSCRTPGHRHDVCPEPKRRICPRCGEDHGEDRTPHAELLAIWGATTSVPYTIRKSVRVYADSHTAYSEIFGPASEDATASSIQAILRRHEKANSPMEIIWTPGHTGVPGAILRHTPLLLPQMGRPMFRSPHPSG